MDEPAPGPESGFGMNRRALLWASLIPWAASAQSDEPQPSYQDLKRGMDRAIVLIAQMEAQLEDNEREIKALKTALSVDRNCS